MFTKLLFWHDVAQRTPAEQMAVDEALLLHSEEIVARLYRWQKPAATFGYAQRILEVRERTGLLPVVRRWTGGGIVYHGDDLTIGLVIPQASAFSQSTTSEIYEGIHNAIRQAFAGVRPDVRLAKKEDCSVGSECFANPAPSDLLAGEHKLCGGAIRRTKRGVIYQGSIQGQQVPEPGQIAACLSGEFGSYDGSDSIEHDVKRLVREKYATVLWNEMR